MEIIFCGFVLLIGTIVVVIIEQNRTLTKQRQDILDKLNRELVDDEPYDYSATKIIEKVISVDIERKLWRPELIENCRPYRFDEIAGFEVIENGQVVSNTTAHNVIGRSIVGGLAFGETGALIGGATSSTTTMSKKVITSRTIRISVTNEKVSRIELPIQYENIGWGAVLFGGVSSDFKYFIDANGNKSKLTCEESTREIVSWLESMIKIAGDAKSTNTESTDAVEEIKRYKQLYDDGIITEDEFVQKKKQLLGI